MNLHEAVEQMVTGKKVRLPEWVGFWFIPEKSEFKKSEALTAVQVFMRDGQISATPWVDKYKDRFDFEVTPGLFGFDLALLALENGHTVKRATGWNGPGAFCFVIEGSELQKGLGYGYGEYAGEPVFIKTICMKTAQNQLVVGWKPTTPDLFAKDWVLVK